MHLTADTETGEFLDDPTEDQLAGLIGELGRSAGSFITLNPADETHGWYASVSLLPDGSLELAYGDPDTSDDHQAITTDNPAGIARTLTTWLADRS
ncbi:MAG: hypothetical protein LBI49_01485 [Nocardiopsaceae bacterium]|jgi:hypothetical protein|nr:hypothetical protein [Nocardiopsaceae bacterium]